MGAGAVLLGGAGGAATVLLTRGGGGAKGLAATFTGGGGGGTGAGKRSLKVFRKATTSSISLSVSAGPAFAARLKGTRSRTILGW